VLEKLGYRHEGRLRAHVLKDGRILDLDFYGILREEWAAEAGGP
jgi:RimJ/RimL family protein N-acetyltransferase